MAADINPAATHHLPMFVVAPGETDILFNVMLVFVIVAIVLLGVLYFKIHALPEHIAHRTTKIQYEIVAVLGLLSLFTHEHIYWIIGLLLALVQLPDFTSPLSSMADSLANMRGRTRGAREEKLPETSPSPLLELDRPDGEIAPKPVGDKIAKTREVTHA